MTFEEFKTPFQVKLDKGNRWIRLGDSLPWDALASIYYRTMSSDMSFPLEHRDQRMFWVIQHIYDQQAKMYKEHTHSVDNRIVNIYQPYVRPIVRGKDKAQVEFGAKLGVSIQNGYARINTLSWEAYNEGVDLKKQVEAYTGSTHLNFNEYPESCT